MRRVCVLLILVSLVGGGCRRAVEDCAPGPAVDVAPVVEESASTLADDDREGDEFPVVAWPSGEWQEFLLSWQQDAGDMWTSRTQAVAADILTAAEATARSSAALIRSADRALAAGRAERAAELFARAADLDPDNTDALMGLAVALVSAHRYGQALPVYQKLLELAPDDEAVRRGGRGTSQAKVHAANPQADGGTRPDARACTRGGICARGGTRPPRRSRSRRRTCTSARTCANPRTNACAGTRAGRRGPTGTDHRTGRCTDHRAGRRSRRQPPR